MTIVNEYDTEGGERKWKIQLPFEIDFSKEYFEDLADAYEAGEVGAFRLTVPVSIQDMLGPVLADRLAGIVDFKS